MTANYPRFVPEQLEELSEEVSRIAAALAELSMTFPVGTQSSLLSDAEQAEVSSDAVKWLIQARGRRTRYLPPDLCSEPAWDILMDLLRAELAKERVSVSSLCIAARVPATTALRHIKRMVDEGSIVRRPDGKDARRVFIELAPTISAALRRYVIDIVQPNAFGSPT